MARGEAGIATPLLLECKLAKLIAKLDTTKLSKSLCGRGFSSSKTGTEGSPVIQQTRFCTQDRDVGGGCAGAIFHASSTLEIWHFWIFTHFTHFHPFSHFVFCSCSP